MSEWFAYDWEVRGVPAHFRVDLQFAADPDGPTGYHTMLYVTCSARRADAPAFSFGERKRLSSVLSRCEAILGEQGRFVGVIEQSTSVRYYFYAKDARLLVPLYEYCSDEKRLRLACAKADEPEQQTYYRLLYPDAAKRQSAANDAFIALRRAQGDEPETPRRIDLTFRFPSFQSRAAFTAEATALGFSAGRIGFDETHEAPYTLTLYASAPLLHTPLTALTTQAIAAAAPHCGELAALGAAFLSKRRPK